MIIDNSGRIFGSCVLTSNYTLPLLVYIRDVREGVIYLTPTIRELTLEEFKEPLAFHLIDDVSSDNEPVHTLQLHESVVNGFVVTGSKCAAMPSCIVGMVRFFLNS